MSHSKLSFDHSRMLSEEAEVRPSRSFSTHCRDRVNVNHNEQQNKIETFPSAPLTREAPASLQSTLSHNQPTQPKPSRRSHSNNLIRHPSIVQILPLPPPHQHLTAPHAKERFSTPNAVGYAQHSCSGRGQGVSQVPYQDMYSAAQGITCTQTYPV